MLTEASSFESPAQLSPKRLLEPVDDLVDFLRFCLLHLELGAHTLLAVSLLSGD